MKNILVTGGAGYIGSHTCKRLSKRGYRPITFDNLVYGHKWAVKWGPLYEGELKNRELLCEIIRKEKISSVLHFAAYAYVGESVENPLKYYENNVAGSLSLLQACLETGVQEFVFSSTCATYGIPSRMPIDEQTETAPINPYGRTKLMVENILRDLCQTKKIRAVALRYFNASGADLETEIGEDHNPETHLIPLVLRAAANTQESITIFGNDYPTADGTCIRDYIHVEDLASAHLQALEKIASLPDPFSIFNLGTGRGYSVNEVLQEAERITGQKIKAKRGPRRPGDPPELIASGDKARKVLNWNPVSSDLSTILSSAWKWHQKQQEQK